MPPALRLRQMIFGHVVSQAVASAVRLGIIDELEGGPRSLERLAVVAGAPPAVLARLLRTWVALEIVDHVDEDLYLLAPLGEWLRSGGPSLRHLAVAMCDRAHWRSIEAFTDVITTGEPAPPRVLGADLWDYYRTSPAERDVFARAMGNTSEAVAEDVVRRYDVSRFRRVVDVGGSHGILLARLLEENTDASGVLFDRPEVIDGARPALDGRAAGARIELRAGDFFEGVPEGGDLYLLKHILHDWDDERAAAILRSCHRAAPAGSTLLLVERVLDRGSDAVDYVADLLMLVMFAGKERSREEFETLLASAGYRLERVIPMTMFSLVEARRV